MSRRSHTDEVLLHLRAFGLAYPGAHTKSPWEGHLDLAVNDKTFVYLSLEGEPLRISCKLPHSSGAALIFPFTTPTGYGLGKSGWVTATFDANASLPVDMLESWIDESYRAQAPKRMVAERDRAVAGGAVPVAAKKVAKKVSKPAAKKVAKPAAKKVAKPAAKKIAKPAAKKVAKPAAKKVAKPAAKKIAKPAKKPAKPAAKPAKRR